MVIKKQLTEKQKSYIARFLDENGHISAQIVVNKKLEYGFSIVIFIAFYQKKTKHWFLLKLKKLLKCGYIRKQKNDNVSEYVIIGSSPVKKTLALLKDYLILKKKNANIVIELINKKRKISSKNKFIEVCEFVEKIAELNRFKEQEITSLFVRNFFRDVEK